MQKIRKKFERCKAQKRFANRVTPWDTAGNAVCLRDGQDVQLPHNVLERHHMWRSMSVVPMSTVQIR